MITIYGGRSCRLKETSLADGLGISTLHFGDRMGKNSFKQIFTVLGIVFIAVVVPVCVRYVGNLEESQDVRSRASETGPKPFGSGAIYYVAPLGGDFSTIQAAADVVQAGDTVYIREGTYTEQVEVKNSGTTGEYITFSSYPGETVELDGSGISMGGWGGLWEIRDRQFIQVIGVNVVNSDWFGFYITRSDHIIIKNGSTYQTKASGIYAYDSSYVTVDGNDVQRAVDGGSQECISFDTVTDFEIMNNSVHNGVNLEQGGEGIDVKVSSANGSVHHNHIYDLPGEVGLYIDGYDGYLHDVEVYSNISAAPEGIAISAEQGGVVERVNVYNNVIPATGAYGIVVTDWMPGVEGVKRDIKIVNNTVFGATYGGIGVISGNVENIVIENNIISDNASWQLRVVSPAQGETAARSNLIDGFKGYDNEIYGSNPVIGDPLFIDKDAGDFHVAEGSPAIDSGVAANAPSFDHDGNDRPNGDGYDIGAYEYVTDGKALPCTEYSWSYTDSPCKSTGYRYRSWTKTQDCVGGVLHPAFETVLCGSPVSGGRELFNDDKIASGDTGSSGGGEGESTIETNEIGDITNGIGSVDDQVGAFSQEGVEEEGSGDLDEDMIYEILPIPIVIVLTIFGVGVVLYTGYVRE